MRPRNRTTCWENNAPADSELEALSLLARVTGVMHAPCYIAHGELGQVEPFELHEPWLSETDHGDWEMVKHHQIDQDIAHKIVENGLVEPRQAPGWTGTSSKVASQLVISEAGKNRLKELQVEAAQTAV